jgi:pilus assembly protein CpaF
MTPISELLSNPQVTEVIITAHDQIWFEQEGHLRAWSQHFMDSSEYHHFQEDLLHKTMGSLNIENPFHESKYKNFRLSMVHGSITNSNSQVLFRRNSQISMSLGELKKAGWCSPHEERFLKEIVSQRSNFLIAGNTGSGKTTLAQALVNEFGPNERIVLIEDTEELALPNSASTRLLTRPEHSAGLPAIDQQHLLKRSLRMRPDRLIIGEMRSTEAKDFLMALSTGHKGSFGTLHANSPQQALLRLEMLIQTGAPQWDLTAIRRLIQLSLEFIICIEKKTSGERRLQGIYKISSLEENGFLIEHLSQAELNRPN